MNIEINAILFTIILMIAGYKIGEVLKVLYNKFTKNAIPEVKEKKQ